MARVVLNYLNFEQKSSIKVKATFFVGGKIKTEDEIYYQMWLEEEFPYYQFNIEMDTFPGKLYNMNVYNGIQEWKKMREKRENYDIFDDEYLEWKLNFRFDDEIATK